MPVVPLAELLDVASLRDEADDRVIIITEADHPWNSDRGSLQIGKFICAKLAPSTQAEEQQILHFLHSIGGRIQAVDYAAQAAG